MSGNDEMLKAFAMLGKGIQQYQVTQASNSALDEVQKLNDAGLKEQDRLLKAKQIGQSLALRLTAAGAEPGQIQAATDSLTPSAGAELQVTGQKDMQKESLAAHAKEGQLNRDSAERIAGIKAAAQTTGRLPEKEGKFLKAQQDSFDKMAKKPMEGLNQIRIAKEALASGNPIGDKSVTNFMARAAGEVGALTEADKAPFGGSQALQAKLKQYAENQKSGKFTDENRKLVSDLLGTFEKAHKQNIRIAKAQIAARGAVIAKASNYSLDEKTIGDAVYQEPPDANAPVIDYLEKWIADPANANSPKLQAAQKKLKDLKGK